MTIAFSRTLNNISKRLEYYGINYLWLINFSILTAVDMICGTCVIDTRYVIRTRRVYFYFFEMYTKYYLYIAV